MTDEKREVSWEDSREVTDLIRTQAGMLKLFPLAELETFLSRADSVGSILDPTGFIKHGRSVSCALEIVRVTRAWIGRIEKALERAA